jgi:hypothetical protein
VCSSIRRLCLIHCVFFASTEQADEDAPSAEASAANVSAASVAAAAAAAAAAKDPSKDNWSRIGGSPTAQLAIACTAPWLDKTGVSHKINFPGTFAEPCEWTVSSPATRVLQLSPFIHDLAYLHQNHFTLAVLANHQARVKEDAVAAAAAAAGSAGGPDTQADGGPASRSGITNVGFATLALRQAVLATLAQPFSSHGDGVLVELADLLAKDGEVLGEVYVGVSCRISYPSLPAGMTSEALKDYLANIWRCALTDAHMAYLLMFFCLDTLLSLRLPLV